MPDSATTRARVAAFEAVLGHHVLGGVEHELAQSPSAAPVGVHRWVDGHRLRIAQELELTLE